MRYILYVSQRNKIVGLDQTVVSLFKPAVLANEKPVRFGQVKFAKGVRVMRFNTDGDNYTNPGFFY
jgi:hypothetical protein